MVGGKISYLQNGVIVDQLLAERGYRGEQKADALRLNEGESVVKALIDSVDPYYLNWLASLEFGFVELDCGLIHGSSKDVLNLDLLNWIAD